MMFDRLRKIFPREEDSVNNAKKKFYVQPIAHAYELKLEKFWIFQPYKKISGLPSCRLQVIMMGKCQSNIVAAK